MKKVCDDIINCPMGDDELYCFEIHAHVDESCQLLLRVKLSCKNNLGNAQDSNIVKIIDERVKQLEIFNMNLSLNFNFPKTAVLCV